MTWLRVASPSHDCRVPMDGAEVLGQAGTVWMCDACAAVWRVYSTPYPRRSIGWYAGWRRLEWRPAGLVTRFRYRGAQSSTAFASDREEVREVQP